MKNYLEDDIIKVPKFSEESGFYTTKKRSKMMGRIRGTNTKPEIILRRALWRADVRFRINNKDLPGKPDIAIKKYKLAIFVDGSFWHGYQWNDRKKGIKSNRKFWIPKIERNIQRDRQVNEELRELGFTVFRFWDHEIKNDLATCLNDVIVYIQTGEIN